LFDGQVTSPLILQKGISGANLMGANKLIMHKKEYGREYELVLV